MFFCSYGNLLRRKMNFISLVHLFLQIILAREYLKDVTISREQLKYLVMESLRGGCQVRRLKCYFLTLLHGFILQPL